MSDCAPNFEHDPCIATLQPLSRDSSVAHPVQPIPSPRYQIAPSVTQFNQVQPSTTPPLTPDIIISMIAKQCDITVSYKCILSSWLDWAEIKRPRQNICFTINVCFPTLLKLEKTLCWPLLWRRLTYWWTKSRMEYKNIVLCFCPGCVDHWHSWSWHTDTPSWAIFLRCVEQIWPLWCQQNTKVAMSWIWRRHAGCENFERVETFLWDHFIPRQSSPVTSSPPHSRC